MRLLRRRGQPGLPDDWRQLLAARSGQWALLDDDERTRLGELAELLLTTKRWEAARGIALTDPIRTLVAAHGALLVLGLDERWFDQVGTFVIRGRAMARERPHATWGRVDGVVDGSPGIIDGQADHGDGPVMVNWSAFRREARNPRCGRDVVLHEMAHKLDMLDGTVDGTPPIDDAALRQRWIGAGTAELEALRAGESRRLRGYAATNPGELFAVAVELFFTRPLEMEAEAPDLYEPLRDMLAQDPAARWRRALDQVPS